VDAQVDMDATVFDAAVDATAGFDARADTGIADASTDGGDACGIYGCVASTVCVANTCDYTCNEPPDPDDSPTLDCQQTCSYSNHCNETCSAHNTCAQSCYYATCRM